MRILAISGSLRRDSYNTQLLRAAEELAPGGVVLELYDGLKEVPPYDQDDDVLIATPEYNSSVPGQLKNALDWASRPFRTNVLRNKPVAVVGATTGAYGAVWAQAELRKVLGATGARVVPGEVAVAHAHERFDEDGSLLDDEIRAGLAEVLRELIQAAQPVVIAA